jgi:hypothetical protein
MLRFVDGFDHYATAHLLAKWSAKGGAPAIVSTPVRTGVGALRCQTTEWVELECAGGSQATVIVGFGFYLSALPATRAAIAVLGDGGTGATTTQVALQVNADGTLTVARNDADTVGIATTAAGVALGSSTAALSALTWYHGAIKVTFHGSTGTVEVRIDGAPWVTVTGADTVYTANASADRVALGAVGMTAYFDDAFQADGAAGSVTDFPGRVSVHSKIASAGDGASAEFVPASGTDNGAMVDDATPDDDSTYNAATAAGEVDTYAFGALGVTGTVVGVQVCNYARKTDVDPCDVRAVARVDGVEYFGDVVAAPEDYAVLRQVFEENPDTSAAWTVTEVDASEFGLEFNA